MNILFFSSYYYPYTSGLTTYPQKILKHLVKKNKITVLTFPHSLNLIQKENYDGYLIIRMPYLFKISKGYISPQSMRYVIQEVIRHDVIFLNLPNGEGIFLALFARIMGKKIISLFHCNVYLPNDLGSLLINFFVNISVFIQLFLSNTIVGYTKDYITSISYIKPFLSKITYTLPPIINTNHMQLNPKPTSNNTPIIRIGFAGRIAREKGIEYLIKAMEGIQNAELLFAGPYGNQVAGEEHYFSYILNMLNKSSIIFRFLGNLTGKQLQSFYASLDVLILPSINQTEAFGMVQVEAMLVGTPVIATNLPGVRQPILLTKMGIIVEPKNPKQIQQAIYKIIRNKKHFSHSHLIKKARQIFSITKVYEFYDNLFSSK
jgi:glycosyltransferase involved in cell wall biosynthesis